MTATDSPARQIRRSLLGMEEEGWKGWRDFSAVWAEALNRVQIEEGELGVWLPLLAKHSGAWAEAWAGSDLWEVSAVIFAALERLAIRQRNAEIQAN